MTDIELIKSKFDIVELIGSYVPDLKKAGANYKARCPFHGEKTASFTVNPVLQIFKCFGCGKSGDVIKFVEEIEHIDFKDAMNLLADKVGIKLTGSSNIKDSKVEEEKKKIIEANTLTAKFYHYILQTHSTGKPGREYSQKRKIDGKRIEDFLIGFAPKSKTVLKKFLISKKFNEKDLIKWGLLVERNGEVIDKFRERLMQPIFNLKGEVAGFSGRYIGTNKEAPKYLNSPETLIYKKNEILYGLYQAKGFINQNKDKFGETFLIIVEGNIDILSSHRVGVGNIVAPLGTAFTSNQAKLIKRFSDQIYFCFDTDQAGIKALIRGISLAEEVGLKHRVVNITGFQDADELICKDPLIWEDKVKNAVGSLDYLIDKLTSDLDMGKSEGKTLFFSRIIPVLSSLKDEILISHYTREVAILLGVKEEVVLKKISSNTRVGYLSSNSQPLNQSEEMNLSESSDSVKVKIIAKINNPDYVLELFFLSLLINTNNIPLKDFSIDYISDDNLRNIYLTLSENPQVDLGELSERLSPEEKKIFEEIVMYDVSKIKDLNKEIKRCEDKLMENYIKKEMLKLSPVNNEIDEAEYIKKVDENIKKLKRRS